MTTFPLPDRDSLSPMGSELLSEPFQISPDRTVS
jgi:hypothetical protein